VEVLRKNFLASIVPVIVNAVLNAHQLVVDIIAFVSRGDFPRSRLGEKQRGKILAAWVQRKMRTIAQFGIKDPDSDSQSMMTETAGPRGSNSLRNGGSSLKQVESIAALGDLHEDYAPLPAGFSEMPASMPGDNNSITESPPPALAELRATKSAEDNDENHDNNHDDMPVVPPPPSSSAPTYNFNTTTAYSPIELPTNPFDDEEIQRRFEPPPVPRYAAKPLPLPFMELLSSVDGRPKLVTSASSSPREILNGPWRGNGYPTTTTTTTTRTMTMTTNNTNTTRRDEHGDGDVETRRKNDDGEVAQVTNGDKHEYEEDSDDDEDYRPSSALPRALRIANKSGSEDDLSGRRDQRETEYGREHQWTREAIMDMDFALGNGGGGGSGIGRYG